MEEIILVFIGTPEQNYTQGIMETRFRRINKTHQGMEGNYFLKAPITDDLEMEIDVYRRDGGGWHPYFKRFFKKICSEWHMPDGFLYGFTKAFMPSLPEGCPFKAGNYTLAPIVVPRYRKDWEATLQKLIPPMMPASDTWRVDCKLYDAKATYLGTLRLDARLINRFSSQ